MSSYFVYLLASCRKGSLQCGVTSNLVHRMWQHRSGQVGVFSARLGITLLAWYEEHPDLRSALHREAQIKRSRRESRLALVERSNPHWRDLYDTLLLPTLPLPVISATAA